MRTFRTICAAVAVLLLALLIHAQPPKPANPQAPILAPVSPSGMTRGTALDLNLTGTNLAEPTGILCSFPVKATIATDANNGKKPTSLRVRFEVPADAPLGFHWVRLATRRGMSNPRLFCIDDLPQVMEAANNREPKTAQPLTPPCTVVARADAEATDYFKLSVRAGQRLSFEVIGRRLGSAFDPEITLLDAATGRELPAGHSNDAPGLQTDARLSYTFKNAGDVLVAVRDVSYRGGPDFHYRLRIGDFPCATTPLPLAGKRGSKVSVRFTGPFVEGVEPALVSVPDDPLVQAVQVAPKGASGLHGWPVMLAVSDLEETVEKEPNNDAKQANRLNVPAAVTARFETKDDVDHFVFTAKKGARYTLEAHTSEYLSPTEVYMVLKNDKGAQVLASNPMLAPRLDFTAPADGDYTLAVEHLHNWGGPDEVYRLTITPYEPGFAVTVNTEHWDVPAGGTLGIPLSAARSGYNGPIEVSIVGVKGLEGTVTIPAGRTPAKAKQPAKAAAGPAATLMVKVGELPPGPLTFALQARATVDGKEVTQLVSARAVLSTALANLPVPPRTMFTSLAVAVTEKPPFAIAAKLDAPMVEPGKEVTATVTVTRQPDFMGEVVVTVQGLPAGAAAKPVKIAADQTEGKVTITFKPNVKVGQTPVTFQGAAKHAGRDWTARSTPVSLVVKK